MSKREKLGRWPQKRQHALILQVMFGLSEREWQKNLAREKERRVYFRVIRSVSFGVTNSENQHHLDEKEASYSLPHLCMMV